MKLWQKESTSTSEQIERFTVGRDKEFDILLAPFDVQGSIAHVTMLGEVGLMSKEDATKAVRELENILQEIKDGRFRIEEHVEDVHSQVELMLTERIGEAGKMIHSGRSRNDQVAVDIKLYLRSEVLAIKDATKKLFDLLINLSEKHKAVLLPGYTHLQIAMPSSFGLWLGAYAESLVDDLDVLASAYYVANKNPLGSGAGYGSSFPLNRTRTTELLQFGTLNWNAVYAQMSRGKTERIVGQGIGNIANTLSRLAMDCCLYINQNFGFISFPSELTTGSSIMPHKKNPDVFELIRAKCNRIQSVPNELTLLVNNLPSGYHRDLQLTKEILFPAIEELKACLEMMHLMLSNMSVKDGILDDEKYKYLFSVEAVNELVNKGIPFREAYKQVGNDIEEGKFSFDYKKQLHHTHEGSLGNLCNEEIVKEMEKVISRFF
ncbi:argininosuccinate lyase [Pseudobacter ginsenosidimutans]|uniref:Argininosuccinate lyase n=1 Tax=Pseudobacter ginsenosidimutans TaxID=661488 RepID=A0A4Q7MVZ5_9BACT|nr:argininosuccinate lyase [Pseudobacter ginsenosidimutans]QEC41884.1 argininosuccinate lyase [Pseudobacter ginsenosidimutans]RZS71293.1 argininosuccinate lyase [Pseudobacter ginsenosidimutans]